MSRRKKKQQSKKGAPEWMTTYGDLVTLLLTFFVLLFSFSTVDAEKWQALVQSLTGNIGVLDGGRTFEDFEGLDKGSIGDKFADKTEKDINKVKKSDGQKNIGNDETEIDEFVQIYKEIIEYFKKNDIPAEVEISEERTEILIRFRESILFDSAQAYIKTDAKPILNTLGNTLQKFEKRIDSIRIDGHTDSRPIHTALFPSNWELSAKRAVNVVKYFQNQKYVNPEKMYAAAYGEHHPIQSNKTSEGMAKNRRVEFFIVKKVDIQSITETDKE